MRQDRIFEVEPQIGKIRASAVAHGEIRLARKDGNDIRRKGTHLQIGRALAKFEGTDDAVGHDSESHSSDPRCIMEVFRIALQDNFFVLRLLQEAKGTGAYGVTRKVGASIRGNDANGGGDEVDAEGSIRLAQMKDDRGVVRRFDGGDQAKGSAFRGLVGGIHDEIESCFDVGRSKRAAIMEANTAAKMEDVGEGVGS